MFFSLPRTTLCSVRGLRPEASTVFKDILLGLEPSTMRQLYRCDRTTAHSAHLAGAKCSGLM